MTTVYRPLQESVFSTAQLFPALGAKQVCFLQVCQAYHQSLYVVYFKGWSLLLVKKYVENVTKKTSTLFSISLKRGKTIITKNYILFCLSLALSAWDVQFILLDRFISDKGRLKTKINSLISMLSKTRYFSTTVMRCCVNSHGTKSHSFRLSTY